MKNTEMVILKALGIILVVTGHIRGGPSFNFFPPYSFHMALFIFISGYFYKDSYENNILFFIKKRLTSMVIPYFIFNAFYALVTKVLATKFNIVLGVTPNLKNFFIDPFIHGHQYLLYLAAWFVLYLFIVQLTFIIIHSFIKKMTSLKVLHLVFFIFLAVLSTYLAKKGINQYQIGLVTIRTLFGLFFFYCGYFYRNHVEIKNVFNSRILAIVLCIQIFLIFRYGQNVNYYLSWCQFNGLIIVPILTSLNGIYLYLFIAKGLSKILPDNDLLLSIGNSTYYIMANHLFVFFLLNLAFVSHSNELGRSVLNDIWYSYNQGKFWPLYSIFGIMIPTLFNHFIHFIKHSFKLKFDLAFQRCKNSFISG